MPTPEPITATQLKELLDGPSPPRMIDVREPSEWVGELGHIAGAELMPLGTVAASVAKVAGEARTIVSICKSGMRATKAAEFWMQQGLKVKVLQGGMMAWNAAGLSVTRE